MSTSGNPPEGGPVPTEAAHPAPAAVEPSQAPAATELPPTAHEPSAAAGASTVAPPAPQVPEGEHIEIDNRPEIESDSAFGGDDTSSYTTSVTSSILDYKYENGRRYHAFRAGQYVMPNDDKEQDRLDLLHHIHGMMLDGALHLSPLKNPQRILDIGTGTGIWAISVADEYPSAEVIGLDLSPIQPGWVPPNLVFQIDDAESEWTFPPNQPFDFIYLRGMGGSIADWPKLLKQAFQHLKPGGWIELSEFEAWASTDDNSLPHTSAYWEFQNLIDEASSKFGRVMNVAPFHEQRVKDAGFEDVHDEIVKVPLSPWPRDPRLKEWGRYMQVQMIDALESYGMALCTRVLGWDVARTQLLIARARNDLRNRNHHLYSKCHNVYGRKPGGEE